MTEPLEVLATAKPEKLNEVYDQLRLLGLVMGQIALLDVVSNLKVEPAARVAAARALIGLKETPESIAERLKRSPFADLRVDQLESIVQQVKAGNTDLPAIILSLKKGSDHASTQSHSG